MSQNYRAFELLENSKHEASVRSEGPQTCESEGLCLRVISRDVRNDGEPSDSPTPLPLTPQQFQPPPPVACPPPPLVKYPKPQHGHLHSPDDGCVEPELDEDPDEENVSPHSSPPVLSPVPMISSRPCYSEGLVKDRVFKTKGALKGSPLAEEEYVLNVEDVSVEVEVCGEDITSESKTFVRKRSDIESRKRVLKECEVLDSLSTLTDVPPIYDDDEECEEKIQIPDIPPSPPLLVSNCDLAMSPTSSCGSRGVLTRKDEIELSSKDIQSLSSPVADSLIISSPSPTPPIHDETAKHSKKDAWNLSSHTPLLEGREASHETLHDLTLRWDHAVFMSQQKLHSYCLANNSPLVSPIPSPGEFDTISSRGPLRCQCPLCIANHNALIRNYNVLSLYKSDHKPSACPKREAVLKSTALVVPDEVHVKEKRGDAPVLPLKKRKTAVDFQVETQANVLSSRTRDSEVSYPTFKSKRMMSIAEILKDALPVYLNGPSPVYTRVNVNHPPTVEDTVLPSTFTDNPLQHPSCDPPLRTNLTAPVPNCPRDYYPPSASPHFRRDIRCKTPAELKEGVSRNPSEPEPDLTAAQVLLDLAKGSRKFPSSSPLATN